MKFYIGTIVNTWFKIRYIIVYSICICIYIYICLCGSVAKASDTQAVGYGLDPRQDY